MWYEDLTPCNYFDGLLPGNHIAVGWLEKRKQYAQGETPEIIIDKLYKLYKTPEIRHIFCGYHECDFCDEVDIKLGATTIWVVYNGIIYNCPALIIHYIKEHNYRPPDEFIEAVLNYDHQYAMNHLRKLSEKKYSHLNKKK